MFIEIINSVIKTNLIAQQIKGRIKTRKSWSPKFTVKEANKKWSQDGTLRENAKRIGRETLQVTFKPSEKPKDVSKGYQYYVKISRNGKIYEGRSHKFYHKDINTILDAQREALERAVLQDMNVNYDTEEAASIVESSNYKLIDEGFVGYAKV